MSEDHTHTADQVALEHPADPIDSETRIGHIHLKVADLNRAVAFYQTVLGMKVTLRFGNYQAFLAAGSYHHHIGLRAVPGDNAVVSEKAAGLHHYGLLFPTRQALARAVQRARAAGVTIKDTADYGVSLAVYIDDPDGNNIELCWDRPREEWSWRSDGFVEMQPRPLQLDDLLAET